MGITKRKRERAGSSLHLKEKQKQAPAGCSSIEATAIKKQKLQLTTCSSSSREAYCIPTGDTEPNTSNSGSGETVVLETQFDNILEGPPHIVEESSPDASPKWQEEPPEEPYEDCPVYPHSEIPMDPALHMTVVNPPSPISVSMGSRKRSCDAISSGTQVDVELLTDRVAHLLLYLEECGAIDCHMANKAGRAYNKFIHEDLTINVKMFLYAKTVGIQVKRLVEDLKMYDQMLKNDHRY